MTVRQQKPRVVSVHIMKNILTTLFLTFTLAGHCQKHCFCDRDTMLKKYISCDTTLLKNDAKLYNQFDCDSLITILESSVGIKYHILTMQTNLTFYVRLQPHLIHDFDKSILVSSGCSANGLCNHYLFDKENGRAINTFGNIIYTDDSQNFIIYFANLDSLILHYIDSDKKYFIKFPGERFENTLAKSIPDIVPESLFDESKITNNIVTLKYHYQDKGETNKWLYDYIAIDLSKYAR